MYTFTYLQCIPCLLLAFTLATGNTEGIIGSCKNMPQFRFSNKQMLRTEQKIKRRFPRYCADTSW